MSLKIIKAGILDSIQDMGRFGYQHLGINPTGVMDRYAAPIANILVGNSPDEALIECHFPGPSILFEKPAIIAMAGADFNAHINNKPVPVNHPIYVTENSLLEFKGLIEQSRVYISVKGGFKADKWLGSSSTNLKSESGGFKGRKLMKDDVITFLSESKFLKTKNDDVFRIMPWSVNTGWDASKTDQVFVLRGSEWNWLDESSQQKFLKNIFYITAQSDRMGYHLASEPLKKKVNAELISSAVCFGTIQLLPDGQLIILMADHQTAGGYPRIAHIISAHIPILAQMKTGGEIRFGFTDIQNAEQLMIKQNHHLLQLQNACKLNLQNFINENN